MVESRGYEGESGPGLGQEDRGSTSLYVRRCKGSKEGKVISLRLVTFRTLLYLPAGSLLQITKAQRAWHWGSACH